MAKAPSRPVRMPQPVPMMKAMRRPQAREIMPVGNVPAARPATYIEIGTVASETLGASVAPTIEPVAKITAEFAPVSACAAASRTTLARTRASSALAAATVMSIMSVFYPEGAGREINRPFDSAQYEMVLSGDQPAETGARYAALLRL